MMRREARLLGTFEHEIAARVSASLFVSEAEAARILNTKEEAAAAAPKGEIVVIVGPPAAPTEASDEALDAALDEALSRLSPSRAAAEVAEQLGIPRKRAYARALDRAR